MLHIRSWCHKLLCGNLFRTTAILATSLVAIIVVTSDTRHVTSYMRDSRPVPRKERTAVRVQALRPVISGISDEESPPVAPRSGRNADAYVEQLPSDVQDDAADLGGHDQEALALKEEEGMDLKEEEGMDLKEEEGMDLNDEAEGQDDNYVADDDESEQEEEKEEEEELEDGADVPAETTPADQEEEPQLPPTFPPAPPQATTKKAPPKAPVQPNQVSQPAVTRLCTQTERMRIFRRQCDKVNLRQSNYNKTLPLLGKLLVDDDHQVIMQDFAKAGSSTWRAILIRASKKFDNRSWKVGVVHSTGRLAKFGIRPLLSYKREEALYRLNNYFKFIVVRHPFDRLVSAWRDKFIMDNGPFTGRGKIIAHMYKREPFTNRTEEKYWKNKAFFREWATYVADNNAKNEHWNPFWWRYPCTVQWDAIVKLETVKRDAVEVFRRLEFKDGVPVYHSHQERSELYQLDKSLPDFKGILPRALNGFNQKWGQDMSIFGYSWDQKALTAKCGASVDDNGKDVCC